MRSPGLYLVICCIAHNNVAVKQSGSENLHTAEGSGSNPASPANRYLLEQPQKNLLKRRKRYRFIFHWAAQEVNQFNYSGFNYFPQIPVSAGCFMIAATQNYFINHFWSFSKTTASTAPSPKKWAFFICASLAGLALNLLVMTTTLAHWNLPYKVIAQGAGIAAGMLVNFVISKYLVFKNRGGVK